MKAGIWCAPGVFIMYGETIEAEPHKHNAIQVIWPAGSADIELADHCSSQGVVIGQGHLHCLTMTEGWALLVEPQSQLGEQLRAYLRGSSYCEIDGLANFCSRQVEALDPKQLPVERLSPLFRQLGIDWRLASQGFNLRHSGLDPRIAQLVESIHNSFAAGQQRADNWSAAETASRLALSESRFLHLFRQQMNIAWRPYILWCRMLCAIDHLRLDTTVTDAAYLAGFADSAHLSRTFRAMFGMTISRAKRILELR